MLLYLIRHGETDTNNSKIITGHRDDNLSKR